MGEGLTNADVILTAKPMSATVIETPAAGVSVNPLAAANFSTNC